MSAKHTPGPWHFDPNECGCREISSFSGPVCHTDGLAADEIDEANARLIAAAPDFLDFARNVGGFGDSLLTTSNLNLLRATLREWRSEAQAVLAKATGAAS